MSGKKILRALAGKPVMALCADVTVKECLPGIMEAAIESDAALIYGVTKESLIYANLTPDEYARSVKAVAAAYECDVPYAIHGDYNVVAGRTQDEVENSEDDVKDVISRQLAAGFTSLSVDASEVEGTLQDKAEVTARLARMLPERLSLEVGCRTPQATTPEDATEFVELLHGMGVYPDLVTVSGDYAKVAGFKKISDATYSMHVRASVRDLSLAPKTLPARLIRAGVLKASVRGVWMDEVYGSIGKDLRARLTKWVVDKHGPKMDTDKKKPTKSELMASGLKFTAKAFKRDFSEMHNKWKIKVTEAVKKTAKEYIKQFNLQGTGSLVKEYLGEA